MMHYLVLFGLLLSSLALSLETGCSGTVTKRYCLIHRAQDTGLACEISSRSVLEGYAVKKSLWRARFQSDYCDGIYEEFLKTLQAKGWRCGPPTAEETETCNSLSTVVEDSTQEKRFLSSEISTNTSLPEAQFSRALELDLDFSNDLLLATANGNGEFASRWAAPSLHARFTLGIGENLGLFSDGWIHYVDYMSQTSDTLTGTHQWNWRLSTGVHYQFRRSLGSELSLGLNRRAFAGGAQLNEVIFEGLTVLEVGAAIQLGGYDVGFGEIGGKLGGYYLFSRGGTYVDARAGYSLRSRIELKRELFELPTTFGILLERTVQDTAAGSQSSWLLGMLFGVSLNS